MKSIKSLFARIGNWFKQLASPEGQKKLDHILTTAYDLIETAMPIVEMVAACAPTRSDDEIVALVKTYLPHITEPAGPISEEVKTGLIRAAAVSELANVVGAKTGIPSSTLNLAVELAYNAFKAAKAV